MFPNFISILDIQSWWEVPSIAHFCSLFRTAFNLLDFDIEDLEEALLTDGTEETSWLQELIVRLLSGCLPNNEISTFNYQMFLRRLFRQQCQEHERYNPFNTDIDFQLLPLRTKVDILHALCDFRLDADDVLEQLKNLEADSLRVEPLGYDSNDSAYWYFYGTRLYREDFTTKNGKKKCVWQVICFSESDWFQLNKKFKKSASKAERQLNRTLTENFLPELPRLFREKERQARKRLLDSQPRRTSRRLRKVENASFPLEKEEENKLIEEIKPPKEDLEQQKRKDLEVKRREAYERRTKLKEQSDEDSQSDSRSESRYEMAGTKIRQKKSKGRQRRNSNSSTNSKDAIITSKQASRAAKKSGGDGTSKSSAIAAATTVGRQTNNSLAAATGQIVIQPLAMPHKKKLKTSQVFRQSDEDLLTGMHKILDYVKNHEDAWPFTDPVEEDYAPNYYSVIRKPMDLQRMEERLDSGYYKNFSKFRDDFQLIVDNCRLYNGAENEYTEMVDNLLKVFERATEKFLDQISSSDDEIAVEFTDLQLPTDVMKLTKKKRSDSIQQPPPSSATSKRKPQLAPAATQQQHNNNNNNNRKRERSVSEESLKSDDLFESKTVTKKNINVKDSVKKMMINNNKETTAKDKKKLLKSNSNCSNNKKKSMKKGDNNKMSSSSPVRNNRSLTKSPSISKFVNSSSPPPSDDDDNDDDPPSSTGDDDNRFDFKSKKINQHHHQSSNKKQAKSDNNLYNRTKGKQKQQKHDKHNNIKIHKDDQTKIVHCDKKFKKDTNEFSAELTTTTATTTTTSPPKPKDKHNKLRETIEKLKAKSEISNKLHSSNNEFSFDDINVLKENNKKKMRKDDKHHHHHNHHHNQQQSKIKLKKDKFSKKKKYDFHDNNDDDNDDDNDSTVSLSENKKNAAKRLQNEKNAAIDALSIATEQTLKDINKWLDDTPKFTDFSSPSNSPSAPYITTNTTTTSAVDEFDLLSSSLVVNNNKIEPLEPPLGGVPTRKKVVNNNKKDNNNSAIGINNSGVNNNNNNLNRDVKRRPFVRDPSKFVKRREIQRTIDRLQPGKSKGNLITNVQSNKANDELLFPLGPLLLSKNKDAKNSLIVKTDDNAPKLSLGSVLDSFGKHKFVDDQKKLDENEEPSNVTTSESNNSDFLKKAITTLDAAVTQEGINKNSDKTNNNDDDNNVVVVTTATTDLTTVTTTIISTSSSNVTGVTTCTTTTTANTTSTSSMMSGATPNLSAWFKAFGAPKVSSTTQQKKSNDSSKSESSATKDNQTIDQNNKIDDTIATTNKSITNKDESMIKSTVPVVDLSPPDIIMSGQPMARQRKISTGSSMSERSSFSQDMDSPRVGIDERLGAYPAPYPSPMHRSPSGASPVMMMAASPRPDVSPKSATYPTFNGQIRVGFYQDTVSTKSSPDKSCSPRDNQPQSPYHNNTSNIITSGGSNSGAVLSADHVYTPNTTGHQQLLQQQQQLPLTSSQGGMNYSAYGGGNSAPPYYAPPPNYSGSSNHLVAGTTSPLQPLPYNNNLELGHHLHQQHHHHHHQAQLSAYYDTSKSLTDQYQAKNTQNYSPPVIISSDGGDPTISNKATTTTTTSQNAMFPMKKRAYNTNNNTESTTDLSNNNIINRSPYEMDNIIIQRNLHNTNSNNRPISIDNPEQLKQYVHQNIPDPNKQQLVPAPALSPLTVVQTTPILSSSSSSVIESYNENKSLHHHHQHGSTSGVTSNSNVSPSNIISNNNYLATGNYSSSSNDVATNNNNYHQLNIPSGRNLTMVQQQQQQDLERKASLDMSKYTNMGYTGPEVNFAARNIQAQYNNNYNNNNQQSGVPICDPQQLQSGVNINNNLSLRYNNTNNNNNNSHHSHHLQNISNYNNNMKGMEMTQINTQQAHASNSYNTVTNNTTSNASVTSLDNNNLVPTSSTVSMPRPTYNNLDVGLRPGPGNLTATNLSSHHHIVDRCYNTNDERMLSGLQTSVASQYYGDKGLSAAAVMFNKTIATSSNSSATTSGLTMFNQPNISPYTTTQNMQATSMYNRQIMTELQCPSTVMNEVKNTTISAGTVPTVAAVPAATTVVPTVPEKRGRKRKSTKNSVQLANPVDTQQQQQPPPTNQGFQSYAGLKNNPVMEPSAISLKTASVVPGSAFNFGPTPTGLGIGAGLYGDKDAYPNFLDDFRAAPNYYMAAAAAAAHHRSTPDATDKQNRGAHQTSAGAPVPPPPSSQATGGYPFIGPPPSQVRPPGYPLGGPFMPSAQAQLMDSYQHYVLNQGLLGPPGPYTPGYHAALSMRQPYDSMTRPSWL